MNYGQILSRAWQITWRWKILWVLGFLTALSSSLSSGSNLSYRMNDSDVAKWALDLPAWPNAALWLSLIGCGVLLLLLALSVLSVIATGGLIAGVQQVEEEGSTGLRAAWRVGVRRFWRMLGISLLVELPVVLLALVVVLLLAFGIVGLTNTGVDSTGGMAAAHTMSVLCGGLLCCTLVPIGIALTMVTTYAQRAAIVDDLPWIQALQRGWQVFRTHLGPSLVLGLINVAIGLAVGIVLGLVALPILLALFALFQADGVTTLFIVLSICAGLVAFAIYGFVEAILSTFIAAAWTLAYRQLTIGKPSAGLGVEPTQEP